MFKLLALATAYTISINATVPPICGAEMQGNIAHHFCNVPGPYKVTVIHKGAIWYGDRYVPDDPKGYTVLTFNGPEKRDYVIRGFGGGGT